VQYLFCLSPQDNTGQGRFSSEQLVSGDDKKLIILPTSMISWRLLATNCNCQASTSPRDSMYYSRTKVYSITVKGITARDLEDILGTRLSQGGKVPLQH